MSAHHSSQPIRRLKTAGPLSQLLFRSKHLQRPFRKDCLSGICKNLQRLICSPMKIEKISTLAGRASNLEDVDHGDGTQHCSSSATARKKPFSLIYFPCNTERIREIDRRASFHQFKCARKSNSIQRFNTRCTDYFRQARCNRIRILVAVASHYFGVGRHLRWLRME